MSYNEENIKIFEDTRKLSKEDYAKETAEAIRNVAIADNLHKSIDKFQEVNQKVKVIACGTIQAAIENHSGRTAILNFADALTPGGLVLQGETTQEECICRCSNLYESLVAGICKENYYDYNASLNDDFYSNRIIYTSDALILKDEDYKLLANPFKVDIITCPAPISCNKADIWEERIKGVLVSAKKRNCDTIILGAWGCGAFGNSPHMVASMFKKVLDRYFLFEDVIFAIPDENGRNYEVFRELLG